MQDYGSGFFCKVCGCMILNSNALTRLGETGLYLALARKQEKILRLLIAKGI